MQYSFTQRRVCWCPVNGIVYLLMSCMSKERGCNRLHSWNEVMIHTGMVVCVPPSKVKSNRSREDDHMYWEPSNKRLAKKKKTSNVNLEHVLLCRFVFTGRNIITYLIHEGKLDWLITLCFVQQSTKCAM